MPVMSNSHAFVQRLRPWLPTWPRLRATLIACAIWTAILGLGWQSDRLGLLIRTFSAALVALSLFGWFERWPTRLPRWLARWVLQVLAVALSFPLVFWAFWTWSTAADEPPFWQVRDRLGGFLMLTVSAVLVAPWVAMSALLRQRDHAVHEQAQRFERERGELERAALDARLRQLQAQVEPHFLFNTLANVRELVDSGSAQATVVLDHLIGYLRTAVPRLRDPASSIGQELEQVRAYLALMEMRMPDRLRFTIDASPEARALRCPPLTLLTLVENAIRHGIDPDEDGGHIQVTVRREDGVCHIDVSDTGIGLGLGGASTGTHGTGTGLATLRERLRLVFGDETDLRLTPMMPRGVVARLSFPALEATT